MSESGLLDAQARVPAKAAPRSGVEERIGQLLRNGLIRNIQDGLTIDTSSPDGEAFVRGRLDLKLFAAAIVPAIEELLLAERTECARIAEKQARGFNPGLEPFDRGVELGSRETALIIADLIRSRR